MRNTNEIVKQMQSLMSGRIDTMTLENVSVTAFIPFKRTVWEFRVDGKITERRYTPQDAAKYWCELHTSFGR